MLGYDVIFSASMIIDKQVKTNLYLLTKKIVRSLRSLTARKMRLEGKQEKETENQEITNQVF
jgi:hypothetical protein